MTLESDTADSSYCERGNTRFFNLHLRSGKSLVMDSFRMAQMDNSEAENGPDGKNASGVGGGRALRWSAYPLRDFPPLKSFALAALMAVVLTIVKTAFEDRGWVLIAAGLLFASMSRYLLPTRYEFNEGELIVRHLGLTHRRPWSQFVRFEECRTGVFLSPFARRHPLENFRGQFVLFSPGNRDEVMAFVRSILRQEK